MKLHVADTDNINVSIGEEEIRASLDTMANVEEYRGSYEWTPSDNQQIIPIQNKQAVNDIVINPIPSNYGRISYNGSVITVS